MIEYLIIGFKDIKTNNIFNSKKMPIEKAYRYKKGIIDTSNIKKSNFDKNLKDIPDSNLKELNEKGYTEYTIIEEKIIRINLCNNS